MNFYLYECYPDSQDNVLYDRSALQFNLLASFESTLESVKAFTKSKPAHARFTHKILQLHIKSYKFFTISTLVLQRYYYDNFLSVSLCTQR